MSNPQSCSQHLPARNGRQRPTAPPLHPAHWLPWRGRSCPRSLLPIHHRPKHNQSPPSTFPASSSACRRLKTDHRKPFPSQPRHRPTRQPRALATGAACFPHPHPVGATRPAGWPGTSVTQCRKSPSPAALSQGVEICEVSHFRAFLGGR